MTPPRVAPGSGARDLGPINAVLARVAARVVGVRDVHLFSTLGRTRGLFRGWLHYSGKLMPFGSLPRRQAELVILRVAALRGSAYELDHHRRLGARAGLTDAEISAVTATASVTAADGTSADRASCGGSAETSQPDETPGWPWSPADAALLDTAGEIVRTDDVSDDTWRRLEAHFDDRTLVEIVLLVCQYDGLATALNTLRVAPDVGR